MAVLPFRDTVSQPELSARRRNGTHPLVVGNDNAVIDSDKVIGMHFATGPLGGIVRRHQGYFLILKRLKDLEFG
jgi:hypothetical protein